MMNTVSIFKLIFAVLIAYFIGSFSFSITISKLLFKKDVREKGSGNAGATNMARSYGLLPGIFTLLGDCLKTVLALVLGYLLIGSWGAALSGMACLTGHCYPVYYGFRGGKGVSVALAIIFAAGWQVGTAAVLAFALVAVIGKKVSLASLSAGVAAFVTVLLIKAPPERTVMMIYTVIIVFIRHSENIKRLLRHEEPDFKLGKSRKNRG